VLSDNAWLDPETGAVWLTSEAALALVEQGGALDGATLVARGPGQPADSSQAATDQPQLRSRIVAAARAAREPLCEIRLERRDRRARGWVDADAAAVLVPREEGRLELVCVHPPLLLDTFARLVELGPRPTGNRSPLRLQAGALAQVLAAGGGNQRELKAAGSPASAGSLGRVSDHWLLEARWTPASGSSGARTVEVIDAETGLWAVDPSSHWVELLPVSPSALWRRLASLLPCEHELADQPRDLPWLGFRRRDDKGTG
jgi:hypothetical protein